jgi:hypothetical protein
MPVTLDPRQRAARGNLTLLCYFTMSEQRSVTEGELAVCLPHSRLVLGPSLLKSGAKS